MAKFNTGQSFADGDQVTGAKLNNIIGLLDIYSGVIADQASIAATVSTADLLLIADTDAGSSGAANKVTIQKLLNDTLTGGTFTNANIAEQLTYGTATGNRTISTSATITNGTITNGVIPVGTFGTTTSTAATITSGTITTGLIPTLTAGTTTGTAGIFTSGTVATLNSTTGTIGTLNSTTGTIANLAATTSTFLGTITGSTNVINIGSGQIYKDATGNVGIGTTSPSQKLTVESNDVLGGILVTGSNFPCIRLNNTTDGTSYSAVAAQSGGVLFLSADSQNTAANSSIRFEVDQTERLRIEAAGTLTSQPTYDNTAAGSTVIVTSAGLIRRTSSSLKYKKDIENLDSSIVDNAIDKLRPVWYRTKNPEGDDKSTWSHVGLIAEEVNSVEPRLVKYKTVEVSIGENGERIETQLENPIPEDVDYAKLSVILLSEVKAQKAKIASLEARIEALEAA